MQIPLVETQLKSGEKQAILDTDAVERHESGNEIWRRIVEKRLMKKEKPVEKKEEETSGIRHYLNIISMDYKPLSEVECVSLLLKYKEGMKSKNKLERIIEKEEHGPLTPNLLRKKEELEEVYLEGINARNEVVRNHLLLAVHVAKKYKNLENYTRLEYEDIIQIASKGLLTAIDHFQLGRVKFSTYATVVCKSEILHEICKQGYIMRIPEHWRSVLWREYYTIQRDVEEIRSKAIRHEKEEPKMILREEAKITKLYEELRKIDKIIPVMKSRSLDEKIGEDEEETLGELIPAREKSLEETIHTDLTKNKMEEALKKIALGTKNENLRKIIIYILKNLDNSANLSLREIGKKVGISYERVRQLMLEVRPMIGEKAEELIKAKELLKSEHIRPKHCKKVLDALKRQTISLNELKFRIDLFKSKGIIHLADRLCRRIGDVKKYVENLSDAFFSGKVEAFPYGYLKKTENARAALEWLGKKFGKKLEELEFDEVLKKFSPLISQKSWGRKKTLATIFTVAGVKKFRKEKMYEWPEWHEQCLLKLKIKNPTLKARELAIIMSEKFREPISEEGIRAKLFKLRKKFPNFEEEIVVWIKEMGGYIEDIKRKNRGLSNAKVREMVNKNFGRHFSYRFIRNKLEEIFENNPLLRGRAKPFPWDNEKEETLVSIIKENTSLSPKRIAEVINQKYTLPKKYKPATWETINRKLNKIYKKHPELKELKIKERMKREEMKEYIIELKGQNKETGIDELLKKVKERYPFVSKKSLANHLSRIYKREPGLKTVERYPWDDRKLRIFKVLIDKRLSQEKIVEKMNRKFDDAKMTRGIIYREKERLRI